MHDVGFHLGFLLIIISLKIRFLDLNLILHEWTYIAYLVFACFVCGFVRCEQAFKCKQKVQQRKDVLQGLLGIFFEL